MFQIKVRGFLTATVTAIGLLGLGLLPVLAAIPGITVNEHIGGGWGAYHFVDEVTGRDVIGTILVSTASPGTTAQVYDGSSWVDVSSGSQDSGSRVRANGHAKATYEFGGSDIDIEIEEWD